MNAVKRLLQFVNRYGIRSGINLYLKFRYGKTSSVSLRGVKHKIRLRPNSSDISTFYQVLWHNEYEIELGFNPELIIDAGANIGLAAVYFLNRYPNATIHSFEPDTNNYQLLEENTANYNNVICYNLAIADTSDLDMEIIDRGLGSWGFFVKPISGDKTTENSVKSIALGDFMEDKGIDKIDLLKIDIEGYEKEFFSSNYESWLPKTRCIIIELHDNLKKGCSKSVFKALSHYDFSFSHKGENLIFINNKLS